MPMPYIAWLHLKSLSRQSVIRVDFLDAANRYSDISGYFWVSNFCGTMQLETSENMFKFVMGQI